MHNEDIVIGGSHQMALFNVEKLVIFLNVYVA